MLFSNLIHGRLIKRYKRFLADVELDDGQIITVHCPNTGAMTGCAEPGFEVWLSHSDNKKRKYAYTWELARNLQGHWIYIHSAKANALVHEALDNNLISELSGYPSVQREVRIGLENSRIDFLLTGDDGNCYVEVKAMTLLGDNAEGYFPDAVSIRAQKHLRELIALKEQGHRAIIFFAVLHSGINSARPAHMIDKAYAELFALAIAKGVEAIAYGADIDCDAVKLVKSISVEY